MTVYVDEIRIHSMAGASAQAQRWGNKWCHMWADTHQELVQAAAAIGLHPSYIQHGDDPRKRHFDLVPSKRAQAVRAGAVESTTRAWVEMGDTLR